MRRAGLALLLLSSAAAVCRAEGGRFQAGVKGGRFFPNGREDGLKGVSAGPYGEGAVGWRFSRHASGALAVGAYRAERDIGPVDVAETTVRNAEVTYLAATARLRLPFERQRLTLFAGAGPAVHWVTVNLKDPPGFGPSPNRRESSTRLGPHVEGGLEARLTRRLSLGAEVRWIHLSGDFPAGGVAAGAAVKLDL